VRKLFPKSGSGVLIGEVSGFGLPGKDLPQRAGFHAGKKPCGVNRLDTFRAAWEKRDLNYRAAERSGRVLELSPQKSWNCTTMTGHPRSRAAGLDASCPEFAEGAIDALLCPENPLSWIPEAQCRRIFKKYHSEIRYFSAGPSGVISTQDACATLAHRAAPSTRSIFRAVPFPIPGTSSHFFSSAAITDRTEPIAELQPLDKRGGNFKRGQWKDRLLVPEFAALMDQSVDDSYRPSSNASMVPFPNRNPSGQDKSLPYRKIPQGPLWLFSNPRPAEHKLPEISLKNNLLRFSTGHVTGP